MFTAAMVHYFPEPEDLLLSAVKVSQQILELGCGGVVQRLDVGAVHHHGEAAVGVQPGLPPDHAPHVGHRGEQDPAPRHDAQVLPARPRHLQGADILSSAKSQKPKVTRSDI